MYYLVFHLGDVDSCDDEDDGCVRIHQQKTINVKDMSSKNQNMHANSNNQMTNLDLLKGHLTSNAMRLPLQKVHFRNRGCYISSKYETKL